MWGLFGFIHISESVNEGAKKRYKFIHDNKSDSYSEKKKKIEPRKVLIFIKLHVFKQRGTANNNSIIALKINEQNKTQVEKRKRKLI